MKKAERIVESDGIAIDLDKVISIGEVQSATQMVMPYSAKCVNFYFFFVDVGVKEIRIGDERGDALSSQLDQDKRHIEILQARSQLVKDWKAYVDRDRKKEFGEDITNEDLKKMLEKRREALTLTKRGG